MSLSILGLGGQGLQVLKNVKQNQAMLGSKQFTRPKTIFGKALGKISGRTEAFELQQSLKSDLPMLKQSNQQSIAKSSFPVSGGLNFGGQAVQKTYLPFLAVVGTIIYFITRGRKPRRRR
jgi:hypothetical protein